MKNQPILLLTLIILSLMFIGSFTTTAHAQSSTVFSVNPSKYIYAANYTTPPSSLVFNITITNVVNLSSWQVGIQWDPAILTYSSIVIPTNNVFAPNSPLIAGPDTTTPGIVVYGAALPPGVTAFTGSGIAAQLTFNLTQAALQPPASSNIAFEGIGIDTFLLDSTGADIQYTTAGSIYLNDYVHGTVVTHAISGSSTPVTTTSNGTIAADSMVLNITGKTISFNLTGSTGDTAFLYADFPKKVINVTSDTIARWNFTVNGVLTQPVITQTSTDTFFYIDSVTFGSNITMGVKGDNIIPELSSVLIILVVATLATLAIGKSRIKWKR